MLAETDWRSEFQGAFRTLPPLYEFLGWDLSLELAEVHRRFPVFIPKRLAANIKTQGPDGVLAKQFLPALSEIDPDFNAHGFVDPIGDQEHFAAPQLIHRYRSRALFTPTSVCPVHCRYCFRKNELSPSTEFFQPQFETTLSYLREHAEISEVIFTGGDPLTLSTPKLRDTLRAFADIPSIKDVRFHTRYPVILPERIDDEFCDLLSEFKERFRTVSLAIHANHVNEFDTEVLSALTRLRSTGIQLLSQTVLLKGINNSQETLVELFEFFLNQNVRPYYLHHPDRVKGGMHFYLPLSEGRRLYAGLRDHFPGWALPQYVIDLPGGHGKVPVFNPETNKYSGNFLTLAGQNLPLSEPDFSR